MTESDVVILAVRGKLLCDTFDECYKCREYFLTDKCPANLCKLSTIEGIGSDGYKAFAKKFEEFYKQKTAWKQIDTDEVAQLISDLL